MRRVLVCDDERHILRLTQVKLERQGYEVETCDNRVVCLSLLKEGSFHTVVLDSDMRELIAEIESDPALSVKVELLGKDHAARVS